MFMAQCSEIVGDFSDTMSDVIAVSSRAIPFEICRPQNADKNDNVGGAGGVLDKYAGGGQILFRAFSTLTPQ